MRDGTQYLIQEYLDETSSRGLLLTDPHGHIAHVNRRFFELMGIAVQHYEGMILADLLTVLPDQSGWEGLPKELFLQRLAPILTQSFQQIELFFFPNRWLQWTGRTMRSGGYALTVTDVTIIHVALNNIQQSHKSTIKSIADMAENRDNETGEHVLRVARMAHELAVDLIDHGVFADQLTEQTLTYLGMSSILHDVGKVAVPDAILLKPGLLTREERVVMQGHAEAGYRIIRKIQGTQENDPYFEMAASIARGHHEFWGGGGYPLGITGEEIPVDARIVAVSDVFDALTSSRPYKEPWSEERAAAFVREKSGILFDPRVVDALHRVLDYRKALKCVSWDPSMSVGESTMDKDHRILIDLINQLARAHHRADGIVMEFVMDELYNYTVRHFQREESYMKAGCYPKYESHQQLHQEFTQRVGGIRQQFFRNFDPGIAADLTDVLGQWLRQHILGDDQEYQLFFTNNPPSQHWNGSERLP
ncbi:MAG: bacteriohemerythrin [Magnetococcales bacterium]|nr:bacteriohemerythrin [Magnetococcales bacterium]